MIDVSIDGVPLGLCLERDGGICHVSRSGIMKAEYQNGLQAAIDTGTSDIMGDYY